MTKVTVPVGVPVPGATGVTVAVIVTGWPKTDGSGEEVTVVRVDALRTTMTPVPVDEVKLASPL